MFKEIYLKQYNIMTRQKRKKLIRTNKILLSLSTISSIITIFYFVGLVLFSTINNVLVLAWVIPLIIIIVASLVMIIISLSIGAKIHNKKRHIIISRYKLHAKQFIALIENNELKNAHEFYWNIIVKDGIYDGYFYLLLIYEMSKSDDIMVADLGKARIDKFKKLL